MSSNLIALGLLTFICLAYCGQKVSYYYSNNSYNYSWKERWRYYYPNVKIKSEEIFLLSRTFGNSKAAKLRSCDNEITVMKEFKESVPVDSSSVYIYPKPISVDLYDTWKSFSKPAQMRVEPALCDAAKTHKNPIFNKTTCQLTYIMNPSSPRCQIGYLKWICDHSRMDITRTESNGFALPESDHSSAEPPPVPFLVTARDSFVSMCGQIATPCGLVHTTANCQSPGYRDHALNFKQHCANNKLQHQAAKWKTRQLEDGFANLTCRHGAPFSNVVHYYRRVFVVAEVDDSYVYHIHVEIMPRIIYHLEFLLANPDIKIMFGCDAKKGRAATEAGLKAGLQAIRPMMKLAGLSMERLVVHRHVFAQEIFLPMEGGCQDPVYNTWQLLHMRKLFMNKLNIIHDNFSRPLGRGRLPVMVLLKRSSNSRHTRNKSDLVRQWSDAFAARIVQALSAAFPGYRVVLFSDRDEALMMCHECQIRAVAEADVLIGVHGAGLSNMLYMRPNSAVVELAPYGNDGRCLLGGGPFSRLAAVMAHNYMIHHPLYGEFKWLTRDMTCEFNITRFVIHIHSFLKSIDFV